MPVPGETVEQAEQSTKSAEETERERRQEFERNVAEALLRQEQEGAWSAAPGFGTSADRDDPSRRNRSRRSVG